MSRPVALITGPTAGIGRSFALALAARGHDLVLVARDEDRLNRLAAEVRTSYGAGAEVLAADLADRAQLAWVESRLADPAQPVDLLVNNAGFGMGTPFLDNDVEAEQRMLDVLVTAVLRLSHAALGPMVARGAGGVINVSSVAGFLPGGSYSAAKAYVTSLSRWADATYRSRGVRVMAVCPGFTRTEFHARMGAGRESAPAFLWLDADALVREALADFDAGKAVSIPSRRYRVITRVLRVLPPRLLTRPPRRDRTQVHGSGR